MQDGILPVYNDLFDGVKEHPAGPTELMRTVTHQQSRGRMSPHSPATEGRE